MPALRIIDREDGGREPAPMPFRAVEAQVLEEFERGEQGACLALDTLLAQAAAHHASDLHLEPWEDRVVVRWRLDGLLHDVLCYPKHHHDRLVTRCKVLARMVVYQRDTPQDGRIEAGATPCAQAVRVAAFPTINGEKLVLRLLGGSAQPPVLAELGFDAAVTARLRELVARPQGTLLLTGPSSSGKTTTIYALLQEIQRQRGNTVNMVTLEDPVEYRLPRTAQTQINPAAGFTFESALRAALRQDPEVIMVGEIRDAETASLAVQAGLTGHLVISTIHSGVAAGVFARLLDMGIEPFLAASSITGVLAQRLLRRLCPHCATETAPSRALLEAYDIDNAPGTWRQAVGCAECRGIGYWGRIAVGEALAVTDGVGDAVLRRMPTRQIQAEALAAGMTPLHAAALQRAASGVTSLDEIVRVLPPSTKEARG